MTQQELAGRIEHTFLKADGAPDAVRDLCREAVEWGFPCAMVNPCAVRDAARWLKGADVRIGTVVGFPLGQNTARIKRLESEEAVKNGAREIDFVVNVRLLQSAAAGDAKALGALRDELEGLASVKTCAEDVTVKLILECCYLSDDEKLLGCALAREAGFDFVKTSTGFGVPPPGRPAGATAADVELMRRAVGPSMGVKAAGGIRDLAAAEALLAAGADRLGCSSGVKILRELAARGGSGAAAK